MKTTANTLRLLIVFSLCLTGRVFATTLSEGLDDPNLTWTTSPNTSTEKPWIGTNITSSDGVDDAVCGNHYVPDSDSWIQTTVVGPGAISFRWKVSCEDPQIVLEELTYFDYLDFKIGSGAVDWNLIDPTDIIAGVPGWLESSYPVPAGTNTLRWNYHKNQDINSYADLAFLDQVKYTSYSPASLQKALNTCGASWTTGGSTNPAYWVAQTNVSLDGMALQSGSITNGQESYLQVTVSGVTNVSFQWKVSSEPGGDWLEFYTNSYTHDPNNPPANFAKRISGQSAAWTNNSFSLSASETYTLTWRYVKNLTITSPQDKGWVDQVVFSPPVTTNTFTLASPLRLADGNFQFQLLAPIECSCRVEVSSNLLNWTTLSNVFTTNASTRITDASASNSPQRYYRGVSP